MRLKGYHPHKGKAFMELDARVADFVRAAAILNRVKQDEIMAVMIMTACREDQTGPLKAVYEKVVMAYNSGEFQRKRFKRPPAVRVETKSTEVEETDVGPITPEIRAEWDDFLKGNS